jgi:uncharacterized membrane-anchored protein
MNRDGLKRLMVIISTVTHNSDADKGLRFRDSDEKDDRVNQYGESALAGVRLSLTALALVSTLVTLLAWLVAQRKIGRPLHMIVEEPGTIDTSDLR